MSNYQPYIDQVVQALVGLLVVFVGGVLASLRVKAMALLTARTSAAERETLAKLAQEGMALVEAKYKALDGPAKLDEAINYVTARIPWAHIDAATIRAAVEKAVLDYNAKVKGQSATTGGTADASTQQS